MTQTTYHDQLQDMLRQADGAYRAGDLVSARQIWEAVLQIDPQSQPALAGLGMTQLVDGHWAQFEQSSAEDAALHPQLARVRELLDSGLIEEAARQAGELAIKHPADQDVLALNAATRRALEREPHLRQAIDQARQHLISGQAAKAVQCCREALELEPGHREAELLLEQAERALGKTSPSSTSVPDLEFDLDLSLTMPPPPAALPARSPVRTMPQPLQVDSPVVPQKKIEDDAPSVRDLLEAASDIETGEQDVSQWLRPDTFAPDVESAHTGSGVAPASRSEAEKLVEQARQALADGNNEGATHLASRAMVAWDSVPGAPEVLEQARNFAAQRAHQIEELMQQAIDAFDGGRTDQAVTLLNRVLQVAPGHGEARDYLARAAAAADDKALSFMTKVTSNAQPLFEAELLDVDSQRTASMLTQPIPVTPPLSTAPALPTPVPRAVAEEPLPRGGAAFAAEDAKSKPRRDKPRGRVGAGFKRIVVIVIGIALVGAGAWLFGAVDLLTGATDDGPAVAPPVVKKRAAAPTPSSPAGAPTTGSPTSSPVPAAPKYGPTDVPELRRRARAARETSEYEQSVALLQAARAADPSNFDVADELNEAQQALQAQQSNLARLKEAKETWKLQDYEEAMRLLYRLPKEMQPPHYNRWLANGWYNLGVLALQRGDVGESLQFFHDGLELSPGDKEMERHREVAKRYRGKRLDSTFSTYAGGIALREMDDE